jgi:hypothetical protein
LPSLPTLSDISRDLPEFGVSGLPDVGEILGDDGGVS